MNGKKAKKLRRQAVGVCADTLERTQFPERSAPQVITDFPAASLLIWKQTGQAMVPAEVGRYWYKRLKRAYRAFGKGNREAADMVLGSYSDLALRLLKRLEQ